jgi:hypothetical protein
MQTAVTRKGRWGLAPALAMLMSPAPELPPAVTAVAQDGRPVVFQVHIQSEGMAGAVSRAVGGAFERLGQSRCQDLFADFSDREGRPLREGLDMLGHSGQSYLGLVIFYDGLRHPRCASAHVLAATVPGARVVFVCPEQFRRLAARDPLEAEALIIHEALHTLGLGENPPTSREITSRVISRCRH